MLEHTNTAEPQEPAGPRICYHPGDAWRASAPVGRSPEDDEPTAELNLTELDRQMLAALAVR